MIIATYSDKIPAVIRYIVGDAYALLYAVNPEITGQNTQLPMQKTIRNYSHLKGISNAFIEDENERKNFKNALLNRP